MVETLEVLRRKCRKRGTAIMLVTHDMGVIAEASDRVAVMYAGRIVEIGRNEDFIAQDLHYYTLGLMSAIPNMRRRTHELTQIAGSMPRPDAPVRGCAFHLRCPDAMERCGTDRPPDRAVAGRRAACWLPEPEDGRCP